MIDIAEFIGTVFDGMEPSERTCLTVSGDDGKFTNYPSSARRLAKFKPGQLPWYFCVSSVAPPNDTGYLGRRHEDLRYAYCIVLDDIGTAAGSKADTPPVEPSWKLESSADNFQWGYLLDPIELTPQALAHYEGCVRGLAVAGYSDPGARGAYRVMRVPGSLHRSGFVSRVTEWHTDRSWELGALMSAMGVKPTEQRVRRARTDPRGVSEFTEVEDPLLDWMVERGEVYGHSRPWVHIKCPWQHEHTTYSGEQSTAFSPAWFGHRGRAFNCFHGHCADRKLVDFLAWVAAEGGPVISSATPMPAALTQKIMELHDD